MRNVGLPTTVRGKVSSSMAGARYDKFISSSSPTKKTFYEYFTMPINFHNTGLRLCYVLGRLSLLI